MLPSVEFIWKVFVSLFAILAGILALYFVCGSALYLVLLAVDAEISTARKQNRVARTDAVAKATIGFLILVCLGVVFLARR